MPFKMEERDERAVLFVVRVSHDAVNAPMSSSFVNKQARCACFEVLNCLRLQIKARLIPNPNATPSSRSAYPEVIATPPTPAGRHSPSSERPDGARAGVALGPGGMRGRPAGRPSRTQRNGSPRGLWGLPAPTRPAARHPSRRGRARCTPASGRAPRGPAPRRRARRGAPGRRPRRPPAASPRGT